MKRALVIYHSKTGITRTLGKEISGFLGQNNLETVFYSINDINVDDVAKADYILLGCWTSGLMIFFQHPEKAWVDFAKILPDLTGNRIGLFTTYKIATGSMFKGMIKQLRCNPGDVVLKIKSRDGFLNEFYKDQLKHFIC